MVSTHRALKRICARHVQRLKRLINLAQNAWRKYADYDDDGKWLQPGEYHEIMGLYAALLVRSTEFHEKAEETLAKLQITTVTEKLSILDVNSAASVWIQGLPELLAPYRNEHFGCDICSAPPTKLARMFNLGLPKKVRRQKPRLAPEATTTVADTNGRRRQKRSPVKGQPLSRPNFQILRAFRLLTKPQLPMHYTARKPQPFAGPAIDRRETPLTLSITARWVFHRWKIKCYENDAELGKLFGIRGQSWIGTVLLLC